MAFITPFRDMVVTCEHEKADEEGVKYTYTWHWDDSTSSTVLDEKLKYLSISKN